MFDFKLLSTCLLVLVAITTSVIETTAEPIKIKFSHAESENSPKGQTVNKFKDFIAERLGDQVVVEVFPISQFSSDNKVMDALLAGDVNLAVPPIYKLTNYARELLIFELPFLFVDQNKVEKFQNSPKGQELLMALKGQGLIGLGYLNGGMKQLSANQKLVVPTDAKGMMFHTMGSEPLEQMFNTIEAIPVRTPVAEVYPMLKAGKTNGQESSWLNIYSMKYFEVQPFITESNHGVLDHMVITSVEFWANLPEETRRTIKSAMDDAIAYGNLVFNNDVLDARKKVIDSKVTEIVQLNHEQRQLWVNQMEPVWNEYALIIGNDFIQAAIKSND